MSAGQPGSMSAPPPHADQHPSPPSEWEGDKMFNIYIYDYCNKRGFRETAKKLLVEADLTPDSTPPIDAKQGLLFEWWTVFWVLFTAKNNGPNGHGNDDALVYTQYQLQQANMRQVRPQPHQMHRMINGNQGPMQNGAQGSMSFAMPPTGPQPNGIPIPSGGPTPAGANPTQPQNFNPLVAGQRPGGPQHRGPNGINSYQSPTMAHSPHNPGMNAGPSPQHPQPPMGQLGPSPHMPHMGQNRMLPPGAHMGAVSSAQTSFMQLSRSPSRPNTPGHMQQSPSLANRQPPDSQINADIQSIGPVAFNQAKHDLGLDEKDNNALTQDDKHRIVNQVKRIGLTQMGRKPGIPLAGPSNLIPGMQLQGQRPGQPQPPQVPQQPPQQQRVVKRNSTSPPDEGSLMNTDNSPPDRKRVRRSSMTMEHPPPASQYPPQQPQGAKGGPQPMPNGAMIRPGPMGSPMHNFQPHGPAGMGGNPAVGLQMGAPPMGNSMAPGMASQAQSMMMQQMQYRQPMHPMPKNMAQGPNMAGNAGTPTPGDPGFNPGQGQPGAFSGPQGNRVAKPPNMMPPPSSPAGGPPKEQPKDGNKAPGAPNGSGHPDRSPQNHPTNPTQPGGQGPPSAGNPQGNTAPPTPSGTSSATITASPSAVNSTPTLNPASQPTSSMTELPANFLADDFMQSVATSLDSFDPQGLFRTSETGIDFEQFREWFDPGPPEEIDGMRND
ncbi:hypothetical protein F5J12DRAFT_250392 [Pisolithus orientalis]|uniref:uncharacterized protein n=1 Tax=Pisolithus orientalis TaxID=936130 RepID=UPI002223F95C|nr:uncharacterized protein F5J12DRAFT_250392 [Pisolithus orientalis]KAI6001089.1 hypothetical protein F5J12DRAFT_250392 [Pisolithus orientalis]